MPKQIITRSPMKVSDLKLNDRNPRKTTDERLTNLEKTMRYHGDLGCIIFNVRDGKLHGGNQRSKKLPGGAKVVITERLEKRNEQGTLANGYVEFEGEKFKYREVDWDATQAKAAGIAANKSVGEWDLSILSEDLLDLDTLNIDMDLTGFTYEDRENLFAPRSDGTKEVSFTVKEGSKELDHDSFNEFEHTCPKCGFEWDK